ncbi:hypothetical protein [Desulfobacula sp.]|uniref:hypothetical protein n=1 Tax=Desulfobacula sp. TaxID=2593537 RepID=UPI00260D2A00|nr:hypothetical protein [Desulfobacula sp.]
MNCEDIIYLDAEYLSKKYEDENNEPVMTSLVRDEGFQAGIKIPFASGGAHSKEVKLYKVSVYGMYKGLKSSLEQYPKIQEVNKDVHGNVCWVRGRLFVAQHKRIRQSGSTEEVLEDGLAFEIELKDTNNIILVTKDEYFSSGYENILNLLSPIYLSVDSNVKCILKVIGWNEVIKRAVGVPYIIHDVANKTHSQGCS